MIYKNKRELIQATIAESDIVLDIGFLGQGIKDDDENWPHTILKKRASEVYGLDLHLTEEYVGNPHYLETSAEHFDFPVPFDVIFAGDVIEHLSNPGLFLESVKRNLKRDGTLVLTTPNTFNLFNLTEKLTKDEPTTNSDHTFYFNKRVLRVLLQKNGFEVKECSFLYTLGYTHKESLKKKVLNVCYKLCSFFTDKYSETLVIVAAVRN